jgi:chromate transporter
MSAVAAGLIAATGLKLLTSLKKNVLSPHIQYAFIAIVFVLIAVLHVRLVSGCFLVWAG